MRKIISILLMCLPLLAMAQEESKYLTGAVPTEDEKVVFRTALQVSQLDKQDLYQTARRWAEKRFVQDEKFHARIVYADTVESKIVVYGDEYLVFSSNALSLDRSRVNYQLQMDFTDGQCAAMVSRIRYTYHENERQPEKYTAEGWITDDIALNKAGTKLVPICGKFRRKTIDLKDELFKALQNAFGDRLIELGTQPQPAVTTVTTVAATPVTTVTADTPIRQSIPLESETSVSEGIAKGAIHETSLTAPHHLMITAGDDEQFRLPANTWGGEGKLFGKRVVFCLIDTQKVAANTLLVENNHFTVDLYTEDVATPYATYTCRKMSMQTLSGEEAVGMNAELDAAKSYNMYVGEIVE